MGFNRIKEILEEKGIREFRLSDEMLKKLDISDIMWGKWLKKTNDPNLRQLPLVADLLGCDVYAVIPMEEAKPEV